MARFIDAEKLTNEIDKWLDSVGTALVGKGLSYYGELMGCIEDTPTEDVVPVVRCKDCEYLMDLRCENPNNADGKIHLNHYCSYGKRREK